jgi:hypothetical protein
MVGSSAHPSETKYRYSIDFIAFQFVESTIVVM